MVLALGSPLHEKVAPGARPSSPPSGGFDGPQALQHTPEMTILAKHLRCLGSGMLGWFSNGRWQESHPLRVQMTRLYIRGAVMQGNARASGDAMVLNLADTNMGPELSENCVVYGKVSGGVSIRGSVIVFYPEEIVNASLDRFIISDQGRTVVRSKWRDALKPRQHAERVLERKKSRSKSRGSTR